MSLHTLERLGKLLNSYTILITNTWRESKRLELLKRQRPITWYAKKTGTNCTSRVATGMMEDSRILTVRCNFLTYSMYLDMENHAIKQPTPTIISIELMRLSILINPERINMTDDMI